MRKIAGYFKAYWWQLIILIGLVVVQVMTDLKLPEYMSDIIDQGVAKGDNDIILRLGGKMLAVALLGAACSVVVGYIAARVAAGTSRAIRGDMFQKVEHYALAEFDKFSTASLITRNTNDIQQLQMFIVMLLRIVVSAPIMAVGGIVKALQTNANISWILAVTIPVALGLIGVMTYFLMPTFIKLQKLLDRLNLVAREMLTGIRVVRAYNRQDFEEKKFDVANTDLMKGNLYVNRMMAALMPAMQFLLSAMSVAIIWFGAKRVDIGTLEVGGMMAFIQYAMQVMFSFIMITMIFIMLPRAVVSARRIAEVLGTEASIHDPAGSAEGVPALRGTVEFKNVSFAYPGAQAPVIHDVSFTARPGRTTAIIGSTGSGKSTLINLIPRFYDVTEGQVLVSGADVREFTQEALHDKIGYVPQRGVLFSGTIAENLRFGNEDASEEELADALETAQAAGFVAEKEEGLDFELSQGGTNVSGGQKQRLCIARALVKHPEIYIFDDSFSALDYKTDSMLRQALQPKTRDAAVIIVAQRISTILHADQIIVLDDGNVMGIGTHRELMASCDTYREIAASQLSEEELA